MLVIEMKINIVGQGKNAGYYHFLFFPQLFCKVFILGDCVKYGLTLSQTTNFRLPN